MPKLIIVDEEIYTHEHLWRSSSALASAIELQTDESHHLLAPALLTTYLAYEAFINFAGFVCRPDLWSEEKKNFKGKGFERKIEVISESLPSWQFNKKSSEYQTIQRLENFRHLAAHGKIRTKTYKVKNYTSGNFRPDWKCDWDEFLTKEFFILARSDIKIFCQSIVESMRKHFDHPHLCHEAFEGVLASASGVGVG